LMIGLINRISIYVRRYESTVNESGDCSFKEALDSCQTMVLIVDGMFGGIDKANLASNPFVEAKAQRL
jgi:hypothetical protein